MSREVRVRWRPPVREGAEVGSEARKAVLARGREKAVGAAKLLGTLLFGTDKAVAKLGGEVLDDVEAQREARKRAHGAIDVPGEPVDDEEP